MVIGYDYNEVSHCLVLDSLVPRSFIDKRPGYKARSWINPNWKGDLSWVKLTSKFNSVSTVVVCLPISSHIKMSGLLFVIKVVSKFLSCMLLPWTWGPKGYSGHCIFYIWFNWLVIGSNDNAICKCIFVLNKINFSLSGDRWKVRSIRCTNVSIFHKKESIRSSKTIVIGVTHQFAQE